MKMRLAILFGTALLLAGCAAGPDYGYNYGYASRDYGSYGPYAYGAGPSFDLNLGFADRDRGDRDRFRRDEHRRDEARAGGGGERHDAQVGRAAPQAPQRPQAQQQTRHEGGDHGHDHDHDR